MTPAFIQELFARFSRQQRGVADGDGSTAEGCADGANTFFDTVAKQLTVGGLQQAAFCSRRWVCATAEWPCRHAQRDFTHLTGT